MLSVASDRRLSAFVPLCLCGQLSKGPLSTVSVYIRVFPQSLRLVAWSFVAVIRRSCDGPSAPRIMEPSRVCGRRRWYQLVRGFVLTLPGTAPVPLPVLSLAVRAINTRVVRVRAVHAKYAALC